MVFQEMQFGEPWSSQVMPSIQSTDRELSVPCGVFVAWLAGDNQSHLQVLGLIPQS